MRYSFCLISIIFFIQSNLDSQAYIRGRIIENNSESPLIGANIYSKDNKCFASSNDNGEFYIELKPNVKILLVSYVGYSNDTIYVENVEDHYIIVALKSVVLDKVIVTGRLKSSIVKYGVNLRSIEALKRTPVILGENDVMRSLTILPGINATKEGSSKIVVRGGNPDQNLILLNGVELINSDHMLGLVSTVNPNIINDVSVFKSPGPAKYGSKISSVFDFSLKKNNMKNSDTQFTLGLLSSGLTYNSPLGKGNLLVAGRTSYAQLFLLPKYLQYAKGKDDNYSSASFYDLDLIYNIDLKNNWYVLFHWNRNFDQFKSLRQEFNENEKNEWTIKKNVRSQLFSLRFSQTSKNSSHDIITYFTTGEFSYLSNNIKEELLTNNILSDNRILNKSQLSKLGIKYNLSKKIFNDHFINIGISTYFLHSAPQQVQGEIIDVNNNMSLLNQGTKLKAFIGEPYFEIINKFSKYVELKSGIRGGYKGKYFGSAFYIDPRVKLIFSLGGSSIYTAYTKAHQREQLAGIFTGLFPVEYWVSGDNNNILESMQWTIGFSTIVYKDFELNSNLFYKNMINIHYQLDGTNIIFNFEDDWTEFNYFNGTGKAYGVEISFNYEVGDWKIYSSYTLNESMRRNELLNYGKWYRSNFVSLHDFNCMIEYKISDSWRLNNILQFQSGKPITLPVGFLIYPHTQGIPIYTEKNAYTLPNQFRLDVSVTHEYQKNNKKRVLSFGIYNITGHKNYSSAIAHLDAIYQNSTVIGYESVISGLYYLRWIPAISFTFEI